MSLVSNALSPQCCKPFSCLFAIYNSILSFLYTFIFSLYNYFGVCWDFYLFFAKLMQAWNIWVYVRHILHLGSHGQEIWHKINSCQVEDDFYSSGHVGLKNNFFMSYFIPSCELSKHRLLSLSLTNVWTTLLLVFKFFRLCSIVKSRKILTRWNGNDLKNLFQIKENLDKMVHEIKPFCYCSPYFMILFGLLQCPKVFLFPKNIYIILFFYIRLSIWGNCEG